MVVLLFVLFVLVSVICLNSLTKDVNRFNDWAEKNLLNLNEEVARLVKEQK